MTKISKIPPDPSIRKSNEREALSSIAEHNQRRRAALIAAYENHGSAWVEQKYSVNRYYFSMMKSNANYIPRSADVCQRLGLKYYKLVDPKPRGKRRNRRAINLDDPSSGADTIMTHGGARYAYDLVGEILERIGKEVSDE